MYNNFIIGYLHLYLKIKLLIFTFKAEWIFFMKTRGLYSAYIFKIYLWILDLNRIVMHIFSWDIKKTFLAPKLLREQLNPVLVDICISKKFLIFWNYFLKGKAWQCIWAWDTYVSWLSAERGGCKNFDQRSCHKSWCIKGSHGHLSNFLHYYILNIYIYNDLSLSKKIVKFFFSYFCLFLVFHF